VEAEAAVRAAVDRFGRIDVLVNNAASFHEGYFEELTPEQMERQLATSLLGPMNVTRAVLPVLRKQRSGHVISIAGPVGRAWSPAGTSMRPRRWPRRSSVTWASTRRRWSAVDPFRTS